MRIAVCFKIVPEYEDVIPADWDDVEHLDVTFVKKIYGCYDEAALETALRLKDELTAAGEPAECVAVTVGNGPAALFSGLYAAGYDQVVRIETEDTEFWQERTAACLTEYLGTISPDLILTGEVTGAADSGLVPAYLSCGLGTEWITNVINMHYHGETGRVEIGTAAGADGSAGSVSIPAACSESGQGTRRIPLVCSVGDAESSWLRMFSLKARMEARKREVTVWIPQTAEPGATVATGQPATEPGAATATGRLAAESGEVVAAHRPAAFVHGRQNADCQMITETEPAAQASWLIQRIREEVCR